MNSWGFLRHNCTTQEAQLLAILIEGSCWAPLYVCKPRPSLSSRRVSPAAAAPLTARAFPPPRARQGGRSPDAAAPPPLPPCTWRGAVFLLPTPSLRPRLLLRGWGFLLRHYWTDRRASQSEYDASSKTRPLLVLRFLPAHTGVTSEEREPPWREKGVPPTSAPTASPRPSSKTATTHPAAPATAHAAVASGADMTRRCMPARPGFPSSPAPGSSPPRCHLRPGSTVPAAAGKRTESPGDRYCAEGLRRGRVAGARVWGRTADGHSSSSRHPPRAQASASGAWQPPRPASARWLLGVRVSFSVVGTLFSV